MAATKDAKVNRFLELVQAERGYTPPVSERFVALSFEIYGPAGEPTARLFRGQSDRHLGEAKARMRVGGGGVSPQVAASRLHGCAAAECRADGIWKGRLV